MYLSFGSLLKLYKRCLIQTVLQVFFVMNMLFAPYEPPEYEFYI